MSQDTPKTLQEHHEWLMGWNLYQDCGQPEGACTNDAQRKGYRQAQAAERDVVYAEHREYERKHAGGRVNL